MAVPSTQVGSACGSRKWSSSGSGEDLTLFAVSLEGVDGLPYLDALTTVLSARLANALAASGAAPH